METTLLSLRAQVAVGTFFMKSPVPVEEELCRLARTEVVTEVQDLLESPGLHQLAQPSVRVDVEVVH